MSLFVKLLLCVFVFGAYAQSSKKRIELTDMVQKDLAGILEASDTLRKHMHEKRDPLVQTQIEAVKNRIKVALSSAKKEGRQGQHLTKILSSIEKDLNMARVNRGELKTRYLQEAFRQIVMLYQSYNIPASYKVFFCKKDRSVWIQKDKKPQNPFETESNCGRVIN